MEQETLTEEAENDEEERRMWKEPPKLELLDLVARNPGIYKQGILEAEGNFYHVLVSSDIKHVSKVHIRDRGDSGRAFVGDEVVVELYRRYIYKHNKEHVGKRYGKVKGIIHRALYPHQRTFICMLNPFSGDTGLFQPIRKGIPMIRNISKLPNGKVHLRKGQVSVYVDDGKTVRLKEYVKIYFKKRNNHLFIVRYKKWVRRFTHPLGAVIEAIPVDLHRPYLNIKEDFRRDIPDVRQNQKLEKESRMEVEQLLKMEFGVESHLDKRDKRVFTVDAAGAAYLDDAFSLDKNRKGNFIIGIHISDVSTYVTKGSSIDEQAYRQVETVYNEGELPSFLLPREISQMCSILPNAERLVISVYFTIRKNTFEIIAVSKPEKSRVISKHQFSYGEAEDYIRRNNVPQNTVYSDLKTLEFIVDKLAKQRKGNEYFSAVVERYQSTPRSYKMVEELMIRVNHEVAKSLMNWFREGFPIRCHPPQRSEALENWMQEYEPLVRCCFPLRKSLRSERPGHVCRCTKMCQCRRSLAQDPPPNQLGSLNPMVCFTDTLQDLINLNRQQNVDQLQYIQVLCNTNRFPQQIRAHTEWKSNSHIAIYNCSETDQSSIHFDLNLNVFTHFTSPIRRYMDLVVHRFVTAMITNRSRVPPYSMMEVEDICTHCSDTEANYRMYEETIARVSQSILLNGTVSLVLCVAIEISDKSITALTNSPENISDLNSHMCTVGFNYLGLSRKPEVVNLHRVLTWKRRIYNMGMAQVMDHHRSGSIMIPIDIWLNMLEALRNDNMRTMRQYSGPLQAILNNNARRVSEDALLVDYSKNDRVILNHFTHTEISIRKGTAFQVWFAWNAYKDPEVTVVSFTNCWQEETANSKKTEIAEEKKSKVIELCVEHAQHPVQCFTELSVMRAYKDSYSSVQQYQACWLPAIKMEAAVNAVDADTVTLLNLPVKFNFVAQQELYTAEFDLVPHVCERYFIQFQSGDFVCLRMDKNLPNLSQTMWTGHFLVSRTRETGSVIHVMMELNYSSQRFPEHIVLGSAKPCTLELAILPISNKRMLKAVNVISEGNRFPALIAKGRPLPPIRPRPLDDNIFKVPGLDDPNIPQREAIRKAVYNRFSLIQGPPGTGKSITGARLAYMFAYWNRKGEQVLYCGPSNKSVDVVAGYFLHKINREISRRQEAGEWPESKERGKEWPVILRVYGDMAEALDFPIPGVPVSDKIKNSSTVATPDADLASNTLHHIIADKEPEIRSLRQRFANNPSGITISCLKRYKTLTLEAARREIKKADIIFCTCTSAGSPRFQGCTNWKQVIIDEAGMCSEPESMIPIVTAQKAEQFVLIGDHKQLQPIIKSREALNAGLNISLFERYAGRNIHAMETLNYQYRMHKSIEAFPSEHFYESKLESQLPFQEQQSSLDIWPGGKMRPLVFCHIEGREVSLPVSTEEGSEESKSNEEEANLVARFVSNLVDNHEIHQQNLVVLSNYRSQCNEIHKKLGKRESTRDVPVLTVVKSQGSEWDYVIISCVRSLPPEECPGVAPLWWQRRYLGVVSDPHQINVAITRAKRGLIIVGNQYVLAGNHTWNALIQHYREKGILVLHDQFLR